MVRHRVASRQAAEARQPTRRLASRVFGNQNYSVPVTLAIRRSETMAISSVP